MNLYLSEYSKDIKINLLILMIVRIEIYVKSAWVSGADKTLKGRGSKC